MPAPALREVQARFWRALHTGEVEPALAAAVLPTATLAPAERVEIYQSMYVLRLLEVLREDFPKTHEALGDAFDAVGRRYVAAHPSEHPSLRHLGRRLAEHLRDDPEGAARPWLADLACLERARLDAFDAPDATALRAADLAAVAPEHWAGLRLRAMPSLVRLDAAWPAHAVWAAPSERPAPAATPIRVWRQGFAVFHAAMDPVEAGALDALVAGASFAEICETVAAHVPAEEAPAEAGALLARWIEDELVAGSAGIPTS